MQPPSTLHKETTVDSADADGNLMIQREIEIFRQKLERLQSELSYSAASRENYSQSNPVHGSTHVLVTNRGYEYVERDIVRPAAATAVSQLPYPVAARIGDSRSVNCSSTHRPSSTSGRADQTHLKSVVCTDQRQSQTSMHRTSRYLRRADKDDNRSSSPSSSSDRSNRGSTDRHINRHRRDDTERGKVEMNAAATTLHVADGSLVVIVSIPQKTLVLDQEAVHFN